MMKRSYIFLLTVLMTAAIAVPFATRADGCDVDDPNECPTGQYCDSATLACKPNATAPTTISGADGTHTVTPTTGTTNTSATPAQTTTSGVSSPSATGNFVPLTSLPFLQTISSAANVSSDDSLSAFFNSLYKICIGIAGAIALFQIIRAGIVYMSAGDSTEKVSEARRLISTAILGLIVVLSPVIVFSIINPSILSLKVNFANLKPSATTNAAASTPSTGATQATPSSGATNSPTAPSTTAAPSTATTQKCSSMASGAQIYGTVQEQCCMAQQGCSVVSSGSVTDGNGNSVPTESCSCN